MSEDDALIKEAERSWEAGDLAHAATLVESALDEQPERASIHCYYGQLLLEMEQFTAACDAFKRAIKLDPAVGRYQGGLATALSAMGFVEEALEPMQKWVAQAPSSYSMIILGELLYDLGRDREAMLAYADATRLDPGDSEAWLNLGIIRRFSGDLQGATDDLQRARDLDPQSGVAARELAWCYLRLGRKSEAIVLLEEAVELAPADGWARIYLVPLLSEKGEARAGLDHLRVVLKASPGWGLPWILAGQLHASLAEEEAARDAWLTAADLDPESAAGPLELAEQALRLDRRKEAQKWIAVSLQRDPDNKRAQQLSRDISDGAW